MKKILLFACGTMMLGAFNAFSQTMVSTVVSDPATKFTDDLIFDNAGNLYCADYSGDAVFKRTPNGTVTTFVSGLNTPNGMEFNASGDFYVCDNVGNKIYTFTSAGLPIDTLAIIGPSGIIKDIASDTMILTTYSPQSNLKKLAPDGSFHDFHSGTPLNGPVGLSYCNNELYVANFTDRKIFRVEPDTLVFIAQLPGSGSLGFIETVGGKLFATAFNGQRIYSVDPITLEVHLYAGSSFGTTDGALDTAKFTTPNGIVVNATEDTMYVSEYNTGHLRMITGFTLNTLELEAFAEILVYPNPVADVVHITTGEIVPESIEILSAEGKTLYTNSAVQTSTTSVSLEAFPSGILFVEITLNNGKGLVKTIVKNN